MRRHVRLEPWDFPSVGPDQPSFASEPSEEAQPRPEPAREPAGEEEPRCPECGAPRRAGADTCPECGTELGGADETASAAASAPQ